MKTIIFFTLLFFLSIPNFLLASESNCKNIFEIDEYQESKEDLIYPHLPTTGYIRELPLDTKNKILSHPKVLTLQKLFKEGENLYFDFPYLGNKAAYKGEHIQRLFVTQVIHLIFPKAKIIKRNYSNRYTKIEKLNQGLNKDSDVHIQLKVVDVVENQYLIPAEYKLRSEEDLNNYLMTHKQIIDMALLKKANSSQKNINSNYKKLFPFLEESKSVSLYIKNFEYQVQFSKPLRNQITSPIEVEQVEFFEIFADFMNQKFNTFFLTFHFNSKVRDQMIDKLSKQFDKIFYLSQLSKKDIKLIQKNEKTLFINDIIGYTPALHSLANVTLVLGPINMLEGIFLDAKVLFMEDNRVPPQYRLAYKDLKAVALKTNRAVFIKNLKNLKATLNKLNRLSQEKIVYPDEVVTHPDKGNALDQLINRLDFQISESYKAKNKKM